MPRLTVQERQQAKNYPKATLEDLYGIYVRASQVKNFSRVGKFSEYWELVDAKELYAAPTKFFAYPKFNLARALFDQRLSLDLSSLSFSKLPQFFFEYPNLEHYNFTDIDLSRVDARGVSFQSSILHNTSVRDLIIDQNTNLKYVFGYRELQKAVVVKDVGLVARPAQAIAQAQAQAPAPVPVPVQAPAVGHAPLQVVRPGAGNSYVAVGAVLVGHGEEKENRADHRQPLVLHGHQFEGSKQHKIEVDSPSDNSNSSSSQMREVLPSSMSL